MKLANLGMLVLSTMVGPCVIAQEQEALHMMGPQSGVNVSFQAESIDRQDPPGGSTEEWARDVHLKGHVVIRMCCTLRGLDKDGARKAMYLRTDEAVYHARADQVETLGPATISFQDYPK